MNIPTMTGNIRYKVLKRIFREPVLILQLEVKGIECTNDPGGVECNESTWWINGRVEHLTVSESLK